ncbi:MAG: XRE family transcriptional regulator [Planctomycetaceae bacterium]|nr:XRE family transcriptional regulator [Planctomycetaceae bacterium]
MPEIAQSIDLELPRKLQDPSYRRKFFLIEASAWIARQLIDLRKRRGLTQKELAEIAKTGQPAISRAERADYSNWSFNTLRSLADAMDARIRVLIEPAEDILWEYDSFKGMPAPKASLADETPKTHERAIGEQDAKFHSLAAQVAKPRTEENVARQSFGPTLTGDGRGIARN